MNKRIKTKYGIVHVIGSIDPPMGHYVSDTPYVIVHFQERSPNIINFKVYKARYAERIDYDDAFQFHLVNPRSLLRIRKIEIQNGQYKIYENNPILNTLSEQQIANMIIQEMYKDVWAREYTAEYIPVNKTS